MKSNLMKMSYKDYHFMCSYELARDLSDVYGINVKNLFPFCVDKLLSGVEKIRVKINDPFFSYFEISIKLKPENELFLYFEKIGEESTSLYQINSYNTDSLIIELR